MKQKKVFAITAGLLLCILAASAAAAGDAGDPLISLSYLTDIFTDSVDRQVEEKLDQYAGDLGAALTAYNAGHDTGNREYAEKVMAAAGRWREQ